jgi:hypothetical protein
MGWIVHRHGVAYHDGYGWDECFESLVAEVVAEFTQQFNPVRGHCWVVERNGEIVGSSSSSKNRKRWPHPGCCW